MANICIDPGHSGPIEPGAVYGEITEAALNLSIAEKVAAYLQAKGYEVFLTHSSDIEDDGLGWRADLANEAQADVFVSIHCNSAVTPLARGVEVYHYPRSDDGHILASLVLNEILFQCAANPDTTMPSRGTKSADFAVLRLTAMPAVLVECGFISNEQDRAILQSEKGQAAIAQGIADGACRYISNI